MLRPSWRHGVTHHIMAISPCPLGPFIVRLSWRHGEIAIQCTRRPTEKQKNKKKEENTQKQRTEEKKRKKRKKRQTVDTLYVGRCCRLICLQWHLEVSRIWYSLLCHLLESVGSCMIWVILKKKKKQHLGSPLELVHDVDFLVNIGGILFFWGTNWIICVRWHCQHWDLLMSSDF